MGASAARAAGARTVPGAARGRARGAGRPGAGSRASRLDCRHRRHGGDLGPAHPGHGAHRRPAPAIERRGHDARGARPRSLRSVRGRGARSSAPSSSGSALPPASNRCSATSSPSTSASPRRRRSRPRHAVARVVAIAGHEPIASRLPELVVLPRDDGTFRLTWLSRVRTTDDMIALFVDAKTGEEVWRYTLIQRQSAVGTGTGVLGDRKKLSTRQASSVFLADDALRPPTLITYDLKGNYLRVLDILDGFVDPAQSDIATDTRQHLDRRAQRGRPRLHRLHLRLLLPALRPPRPGRQQPRDPRDRAPGAARRIRCRCRLSSSTTSCSTRSGAASAASPGRATWCSARAFRRASR